MQRRNFLYVLLSLALLALAGCGPSEEQQAKAFADYLDQHILQKQGARVPTPTDKERESFGHFARDYEVFTTFQSGLDLAAKDFSKGMHSLPRGGSAADLAKYRPDMATARDFMVKINKSVDDAASHAQDARAGLKQPEVVKTRFDQAFERLIVQPQKAVQEMTPAAIETLDAEIAIADFVIAHKDDVSGGATSIQVSNPDLRAQLQKLLETYNAKAPKLMEAARKMQALAVAR